MRQNHRRLRALFCLVALSVLVNDAQAGGVLPISALKGPTSIPLLPVGPPVLQAEHVAQPCDPPVPIVRVRVRVLACVTPGQDLHYCICVDNCSPAAAHHVVLRNELPSNAKFVSADPQPSRDGDTLRWSLGTLPGGCQREIKLVLAPLDTNDIKNCTRVQFEHGQCVTTRVAGIAPQPADAGAIPSPPKIKEKRLPDPRQPADQVPDGKEPGAKQPDGKQPDGKQPDGKQPDGKKGPPKIIPTPPAGNAKLTLTTTGPARQYVDYPTEYYFVVENTGKASATSLQVSTPLPKGMKFLSAEGGTFLAGSVVWQLGDLKPGKKTTLQLRVKSKIKGELCLKVLALADDGDTDRELRLTKEICTNFSGISALLLEFVDENDPAATGENVDYPVTIINQGSEAATNIRVRIFLPTELRLLNTAGPTNNVPPQVKAPPGYNVVEFQPLDKLPVNQQAKYSISARAERAGDVRVKAFLLADQLESGPVVEEEPTTIYEEKGGIRPQPQTSRLELPPKEELAIPASESSTDVELGRPVVDLPFTSARVGYYRFSFDPINHQTLPPNP